MQKTTINSKGHIMIEKAEDLSHFWAYDFAYSKNADLTLLDNVQFIYELSLAELELRKYAVIIIGNATYQGREVKTNVMKKLLRRLCNEFSPATTFSY